MNAKSDLLNRTITMHSDVGLVLDRAAALPEYRLAEFLRGRYGKTLLNYSVLDWQRCARAIRREFALSV